MYIESLRVNINLNNTMIITDVDDCLIESSKAIDKIGINRRIFWMNKECYDKNKDKVFKSSELTDWGEEFTRLISGGFSSYKVITAGRERTGLLIGKLGIDKDKLIESMADEQKIEYLNTIGVKCVYVDDKLTVINGIDNGLITTINHPKRDNSVKKQYKKTYWR